MTIREVIELLTKIFESLMEYLAPLFSGSEEEGEGEETEVEA